MSNLQTAQVKTVIYIYTFYIWSSAHINNKTKIMLNLEIYSADDWLHLGTNNNSSISITPPDEQNRETQKLVSQVKFHKADGRINRHYPRILLFFLDLSVSSIKDHCFLFYHAHPLTPHNQ